ncbi:hypothetical protein [Arthrobacter sp. 260]|uniref:hypothetical protein n=1 Tax=Arthrobacter sp. 260 TaxID=2735314 RepID=UPI0014928E90|nr:hypothetical protein [Arthrobacter sp. 260]NOJ60325.1 hypothetical protein [Arthrobacter sp. 260]
MNRKRPRRSTWREPAQTPIMLPHAVVTVAEAGVLDVTVDGSPFLPPADGQAWTRRSFGVLLDAITEDRTTAVRIEVRETDGSVFTDIIHSGRRTPPKPPEADPEKQRGKHDTKARTPELVEVTGDGFVPGEDVAVAVIVSHTDATGTGHARTLLDKTQISPLLRDGTREVVLLGRISGTVHVRRLP